MFDHMIQKNDLSETFAKYDLGEKEVNFIKKLISGAALKGTSDGVCVHICFDK